LIPGTRHAASLLNIKEIGEERMNSVPSVLCPVDFSEPSRMALGYAGAIADHFGARLTVLAIDDPFLAEAARSAGLVPSLADETMRELRRVCNAVLGDTNAGPKDLQLRVTVGKPASEILREARDGAPDLIVMSSRGQSGARKLFFGSTTERVLRATPVPVLVTPSDKPSGRSLTEMARHIKHVLAPVDLTSASPRQLSIAAGIAQAISVPLIAAYVLEPVAIPSRIRLAMSGPDTMRRSQADEQLTALTTTAAREAKTEALVVTGDPADEIVKLSDARNANLIVMGLHSSDPLGPRMGSVTYRVLCQTRALVLAIPPKTDAAV
jgi:nucleotide-binding universal stress UspA family protein